MADHADRLRDLYAAFNARDIDTVLSAMTPEVDWPNGMKGTRELGHAAVRQYWIDQWKVIDPSVEPLTFSERPDGSVDVEVHQVVRDIAGVVQNDRIVHHVYRFNEDWIVTRMDIED